MSYGHAYVVYGRLDAHGQMVDPHVGAIHPASNSSIPYMIGHFLPVPADHGASDGDLEDQYVSARYRVMLSEAEYNRVVAYIKELEGKPPTNQDGAIDHVYVPRFRKGVEGAFGFQVNTESQMFPRLIGKSSCSRADDARKGPKSAPGGGGGRRDGRAARGTRACGRPRPGGIARASRARFLAGRGSPRPWPAARRSA